MAKRLTCIDLFSGCGGLTLGLKKANFTPVLAVEKSAMAAETYYHNFIERLTDKTNWNTFASEETSVLDQAKAKLVVKELKAVLACDKLIDELRQANIDLIAGGPPCQGFSRAGRRDPTDLRNQLPWQFLEMVERVSPKAVIIENVEGMSQRFENRPEESAFNQLGDALSDIGGGYTVQPVLLNAMHFGVPQHRPRVMLIALRSDIADVLQVSSTNKTWKSSYDKNNSTDFFERPALAPKATHFGKSILTVRDALGDIDSSGYTPVDMTRSVNSLRFTNYVRDDVRWMPPKVRKTYQANGLLNHNLRRHNKNIEDRFRLYQYIRDNGINPRILNIPAKSNGSDAKKLRELKQQLEDAQFPAFSPDGTNLANNVDELAKLMIELSTKKHSQRPLAWDEPARTVVSIPDDHVHPQEARTLTVREMARFQSFPDSFEFRSKETTGGKKRRVEVPQYTQVGNAVPPLLGLAVGKMLAKHLRRYSQQIEERKNLVAVNASQTCVI